MRKARTPYTSRGRSNCSTPFGAVLTTCGDAGWAEEGDMITLICWAVFTHTRLCPDCPPKALISKQKVLKRKVTHYISRRLKVTEKEKIRIRGKSKRKIRDDPRQRSSRKRE
ncbi:hypothetical protein OPV22_030358 [Ensete ventricosum]|uniref:CCT domain-containing protein n=1 Tax=Ensete ventricosum TaxID=4639 RepID=A0AAV8P702_ENSVE|nr:hypothetical protein OPV22_030358 [Ensete ventricosum]